MYPHLSGMQATSRLAQASIIASFVFLSKTKLFVLDMLGFKVESPAYEKSTSLKSRPIYLDMQV